MQGPVGTFGWRRLREWAPVFLAVLPFLALAVVAVVVVGHGYHGADDNAMTELRVSDIGHHWPTIGPFSRDGWSHPGPAIFYALVVPFRLTGSHSNGLLVGAALINAAAVAGMVVLARRAGDTALALLVALGCLVLTVTLGGQFLWDPWNPYITVFPFGLAVLAAWSTASGDAWCLPLLVVVGSFCAQTHIEFAPLFAVLLVVAVVGLIFSSRVDVENRARATSHRRPVIVALVLAALCWAPPVFQQLTADPGNLWAIWHYFRHGDADHSLRTAFNVVSAQFAWDPGWLVGRTDLNPFTAQPTTVATASVPVLWAGIAGGVAWTWRTGRVNARTLGVVLGLTIAAGVIAIERTLGPIYEYRLRFLWVLGMLSAAYVLWVVQLWLRTRLVRSRRIIVVASVLAAASATVLSAHGIALASSTRAPNEHKGRLVAALDDQLVRTLRPGPGVVIPGARGLRAGPLATGIMVDLEHAGIPVRVRDNADDRLRFGDGRILSGERVRAEIRIAVDDQIDTVARSRCARLLAYWGRASLHARQRAVQAVHRIEADLTARRISGPEAFRRLERWSPLLPAAAIFRTGCPRDR